MENSTANSQEASFTKKVWIVGGVFALIVVILLLIKATFSVFLLILAGALIAVFFWGLSGLICRKTNWKESVCLALSIIVTIVLISGLFWLVGSKFQSQVEQLSDTFPTTIENAKRQLNQNPFGQKIVERVSSPGSMEKAQAMIRRLFETTFGIFGDIYVILFIGIFFTVSPQVYKDGLVKLVPRKGRQKADEIVNTIGESLKKWLKGKLFAMFVVFVLTAAGLLIIGMPMWLVLALIAGIFNFIPNFGPLIALLPAILVALMQGPITAAIVAGLYILIQVIESNFITPLVQQKLISIPPALIIIAQLLIAPLTGGWGLVLATPLMVMMMVLVQELYIKKQERA